MIALNKYQRIKTIEVRVGDVVIGGMNPIAIQTMTTTDTMDTAATVEQCIRCVDAGAELVRITAPSKKEAENLREIKKELRKRGYNVPLIADIHYTPNAAEIAAGIVEKVRINPGNYIDKKIGTQTLYSDVEYKAEIEKIKLKFLPLLKICKQHKTAIRIGTNHGSLSDRILSRYGDTPIGMVESAMEFLRIAVNENFLQIILSMKASNPLVMVQAYRVLVQHMMTEFGFCFPLHLGVTEAGDGEDGRIKSAIGICTLLEDGIGDTIRVSLTEDPEFELPVCREIVERYKNKRIQLDNLAVEKFCFNTLSFEKKVNEVVENIGGKNVPVVLADLMDAKNLMHLELADIGYEYIVADDKWHIKDNAADFIVLNKKIDFDFPKSLKIIVPAIEWKENDENVFPKYSIVEWFSKKQAHKILNFIELNIDDIKNWIPMLNELSGFKNIVLMIETKSPQSYHLCRAWANTKLYIKNNLPFIWTIYGHNKDTNIDNLLIHYSSILGSLSLDGFGDGVCLVHNNKINNLKFIGRTYLENCTEKKFLNETAFSILQASRTRITKTEYISCPSCGRTLFDLQSTTNKIRNATKHLKGVKIAIMGCIVNGPGEMADADFGYVGSGIDKIHLYKAKEIVKKNIDANVAVEELIQLIKDNGRWND